MPNEFLSREGDLEKYFISEYWLIDQYVGDKLFSWGDNQYYQLGVNDTTLGRLTPIETLYGGNNWKQVSCGGFHSIALKSDSTLWSWGYNSNGQLGLNDTDSRGYPIQIGNQKNWKIISCGILHSASINSLGELYTWGLNDDGQLALNDTNYRTEPQLVGSNKNWRFVYCGGFHTVAIKDDGTLWSWGKNNKGQLGLGDTDNRLSPTQIGSDTDWKKVSCGSYHTVAIKNDGSLWSWGLNNDPDVFPNNGLLGLGSDVSDIISTPSRIGLDYNWKYVNCGAYHSGAIKNNGSLWMWGRNDRGQLGTNETTPIYRNSPTEVYGSNLYEWKQIGCGGLHTMGLKLDGTLWFWGDREYYQSAITPHDGTQPIILPSSINNFKNNWKQVSSGFYHSSAVTSGSNPLLYIS